MVRRLVARLGVQAGFALVSAQDWHPVRVSVRVQFRIEKLDCSGVKIGWILM